MVVLFHSQLPRQEWTSINTKALVPSSVTSTRRCRFPFHFSIPLCLQQLRLLSTSSSSSKVICCYAGCSSSRRSAVRLPDPPPGNRTWQYCGTGKKLHRGGSNSVRIMRIIASRGHATRAGAATAHGEDDVEPKRLYRSSNSATTSSFGLNLSIAERSEVGLKKMSANNDDVLLPHDLAHCEFLQLAFRICDEVESKLELHRSKKPHRLSTTSWDLLD